MRLHLALPAFFLSFPIQAQALEIVTDIAPIHSLVAQVAGPDADLSVLVSGAASPHDFQFSFDQAAAVQSATVIIWAGPGLTPWLDDALSTLAPETQTLTLLETDGWPKLERREDLRFDLHDHDHDHDHDEHTDPHAWLNPDVAAIWTQQIAAALSDADPDNADLYAANAATTLQGLADLNAEIETTLATVPNTPFLVPHDAYHYFGDRFGHPSVGAISLSDAAAPSPDQITALRTRVREEDITCVLNDPQSRSEWVDLVREGTDAKTALADPIGIAFSPGPDHYTQTLRALAKAYAACLTP